MTASDLAPFHAEGRRTEELPAVQVADDPNVIRFTKPSSWSYFEVFAALRNRCGIVEPRHTTISRIDGGWSVRVVLR